MMRRSSDWFSARSEREKRRKTHSRFRAIIGLGLEIGQGRDWLAALGGMRRAARCGIIVGRIKRIGRTAQGGGAWQPTLSKRR